MDRETGRLTVFFEEPFWVGVFERISDGKMTACKVTFGAEPKEFEVYEFILQKYGGLRFGPAVAAVVKETARNPKRMQREARRETETAGIGTKSQQALKLQHEQGKLERRQKSRREREEERERQFELKQQKRKEKHRGR